VALNAVRVALAVLLAAALLGASLPAAEEAAASRTAAAADASADRITAAVETLRRSDATRPELPGARRAVEIRFPGGVLSHDLAYIAVGGIPGATDAGNGPDSAVVAYRLRGHDPRIAAVVSVDIRAGRNGTSVDGEPLVVRDDATVVFRLVERDNRPVVHTFMRKNATTGGRG